MVKIMDMEDLYDRVVECVETEFPFNEDESISGGYFEATYFISMEKGHTLEIRNDQNGVSIEYGLGLGPEKTESGIEYTRVLDPRGIRTVKSVQEAREFLENIENTEITITNSYKFWQPDELINLRH